MSIRDLSYAELHCHSAFSLLDGASHPDALVERAGVWIDTELDDTHDPAHHDPLAITPAREPRTTALRLLETPQGIDVERVAGIPVAMWWRGHRIPFTRASGPERLSGDWWKDGYDRDYWRCESEMGDMIVFEEGETWFVQGWED